MRLIPLGVNGYFPSFGRHTMCFLVLTDHNALLLDAGTGLSRLIEPPVADLLSPYSDLDIVLSHYHLDHVIGLTYLPAVWPRGRIRVHGPSRPVVEADPAEALHQLTSPPLFSASYRSFPGLELIPACESFDIGELTIHTWPQRHPGGSIGIRIGNRLAYITDTSVNLTNAPHAMGVDLLLHEMWFTDEEAATRGDRGHSHISAVAEFAKAASTRRVMAVHHHPKRTAADLAIMSTRLSVLAGMPAIDCVEGRTIELN